MTTVYQIARRICIEYPNNGFIYEPEITSETPIQEGFIDFINRALTRIEKYVMLDGIYEFPTIRGQRLYELPLDCDQSNIEEITRDFSPYTTLRLRWARDAERLDGARYWNGYGNTIGLSPIPLKDGEKCTIFYKHTPRPVKTMDDPIEIKDKWVDLIVYSVVSDMASSGSNPDIEIANNYTLRYNTMLEQARIESQSRQPFYSRTKDNKRPPTEILRRGRV